MESFALLASILPLSLTSGVNLYATVLMIGLVYHLGWLSNLPPGVDLLVSLPVLCVAGILYAIEFAADKVQFVDNAWDVIHTVIRPLGAVAVASSFATGLDPALATAAALTAGGTAFTAHSGKAGFRFVLNTLSPAENASNVTVSLLEDLAVAVLVVLALMFPYVALAVTVIALILILTVLPMLLRWSWFRLRSVFAALRANVQKISTSETLPQPHLTAFQGRVPPLSVACRAQGIKGAAGHAGYLSLIDERLVFSWRTWGTTRLWELPLAQISAAQIRRRFLADVITIYVGDQHIEFAFFKDRAPLVDQLAAGLGALDARAARPVTA